MFDHLSSEPDPPGLEVRDAVHVRARLLRRRRWAGVGTAGATLVSVLLVVTLSGPGESTAVLFTDEPSATPSPWPSLLITASAVPEATLEPTPAPAASPTPGPAVTMVTLTPSTSSSPLPACAPKAYDQCPDGRPGWSHGFSSSCHDATASDVPAAREELFDGVTATWVLSRTTAEGGQSLAGKVRVHSTRQDHVVFDVQFGADPDPAVYGEGRGGAVHVNELGRPGPHVDLLPGQTQTFDLGVGTTSCADTSDLPEPPLPPGSYAAGKTLAFDRAATVASNSETATPKPGQTPSAATTPRDGPVPPRGQFAIRQQMTLT